MCFTASVISLLPRPREREQQQKVLGPFVSVLSLAACPLRLISSNTHCLEKNLCYWIPGNLPVYPKPMGPLYFLFQKAMFLPASHPCHLLSRTVKSLEILPNLEASTPACHSFLDAGRRHGTCGSETKVCVSAQPIA